MRTEPEIHDVANSRLRGLDQRYTQNRKAVVTALARATAPLTITDVLEAAPGLAQSSTYRNLAVLEEAGVVHRIVTGDDHARFELAEDVTGAHHHHLVCASCGLVVDVVLSDELEHLLHHELDAAADREGFETSYHRVDLVGHCGNCRG